MMKFREVFVIDDDDIYLFAVKKLFHLTDFTHQLNFFSTGMEALKELNKRSLRKEKFPDIIFVDLNMPVDDGWNFIEQIEPYKKTHELIVFLASSTIDTQDIEKAAQLNDVEKLMIKPINESDLLAIKQNFKRLLI